MGAKIRQLGTRGYKKARGAERRYGLF